MTDAAQAYRPSPRPRPAGAPSRPAPRPLHVVPVPDSEVPTSEVPEGGFGDPITAGHSGSTPADDLTTSEVGFRVRTRTAFAASRAYWSPPSVFTDRPASLADLAAYAKQAPWTDQRTGFVRSLGAGYYRLFAYPYTVKNRYAEWFVQRPLRFAVLLGGIKLTSMTGPGGWVVDTVVYPVAQFAGHIFL